MRVVLDSNLLLSALFSPHGPPHRIFQAWRQGAFDLVTCPDQPHELRRASRYPKFRDILQPHRVGLILNNRNRAVVIDRLPKGFESAGRTMPGFWPSLLQGRPTISSPATSAPVCSGWGTLGQRVS